MAKRFTDSNKWDDPFFTGLPNDLKLVWLYMLDKCDYAGIFKVNFDLMKYQCNCKRSPEEIYNIFRDRIIPVNGEKWFIKKFIKFQYPSGLESKKPVIIGVNRILEQYGLLDMVDDIYNDCVIISNDNLIIKDKDMDKEKDKEKDKVKDVLHTLQYTYKTNITKSDLQELKKVYTDDQLLKAGDNWHNVYFEGRASRNEKERLFQWGKNKTKFIENIDLFISLNDTRLKVEEERKAYNEKYGKTDRPEHIMGIGRSLEKYQEDMKK